MVLLTEDGQTWYRDRAAGDAGTRLDAVAVGSGIGAENSGASALSSEEFRAEHTTSNVSFNHISSSETRATVQVTGGVEVPAGTEITEVAILADGAGGGGDLVWVDEFTPVEVPANETATFGIEYDHTA